MKKNWLCGICLALIALSGCGGPEVLEKESSSPETTQTESVPATDDSDDVASDAETGEEQASDAADDEFFVIDVRSAEEYKGGHIDGTINIAHTEIVERIKEVTSDKSAKIYCH